MTVCWANAIIYDPESRSTPIFHQSTYYSSITNGRFLIDKSIRLLDSIL